MKKIALHLSRATWFGLVVLTVFVAVVLSVARIVLPMADEWRDGFRETISQLLGAPVVLGELQGRFHNFNPALGVDSLIIYQPDNSDQPSLELYDLVLELDTLSSLTSRRPVFRQIVIGSGDLQLTGKAGNVALTGFSQNKVEELKEATEKPDIRYYLDLLSQQKQIDFRNLNFSITMPSGVERDIQVERMLLSGPPNARRMAAIVQTGDDEVLELTLKVAGRTYNWPDVVVNGYASVPAINLKPWLPLLPSSLREDAELQVNQLRAGSSVWFSYTPSGWDVRGDLHVEMLDIDYRNQELPPLTSLRSGLGMKFGHDQPVQVWLDKLSLRVGGFSYPESSLYLSWEDKPERDILLAADKVHLQPLALIAASSNQLPELLDEVVTILAPRGRLQNLVLRTRPDREPLNLSLVADLRDVGVDKWYGAPSGERINARVHMTADAGVIDLDSPGFTLGLDNVFEDIWVFDRAAGRLYWHIVDDVYVLRSDDLSLTGGEGDIEGRLRLDIPFDADAAIWMALEAGITQGDMAYTGKYLPVREALSSDLSEWLNSAIRGGDINHGAFIFNGPLSGPDIDNDLSWGLFFDIANANIAYSPDWPELTNLDGLVIVDQDDVLVRADKAKVYDSWAKDIYAKVPDILSDDPLILELKGSLASHGADGLRALQETPIATAIDHAADDWKIEGDLGVGLDLKIPLEGDKGEDLRVSINLSENSLYLPEVDLEATSLVGEMFYSSAKGLYGSGLSGVLLEEPVTFDISSKITEKKEGTDFQTLFDLKGQVSMNSLSQWLKFDLSPYVEGKTQYQAHIKVSDSVRVDVETDLVGVSSLLPAPLDKAAGQKEVLKVKVEAVTGKPVLVSDSWQRGISSIQELDSQGELERVGISFGKGTAILPDKGVLVTGQLDSLKLEPWVHWWEKFNTSTAASTDVSTDKQGLQSSSIAQSTLLQHVDVSHFFIQRLLWDEEILSDVRVGVTRQQDAWDIRVDSPQVSGKAEVPDNKTPLRVEIDNLVLPDSVLGSHEVSLQDDGTLEVVDNNQEQESASDPLSAVNPSSVPYMDVLVRNVLIGKNEFGYASFNLRSIKNGLRILNLTGQLGRAELDGSLEWTQVDGHHQTHLQSAVTSDNVEKMLDKWGYPELMTGKKLTSHADLRWDATPAGFSVNQLRGTSSLDIRDGRFLSVDTSSGSGSALRLFGVLNIDAITRRLRLDFSDLYRSGMAFDRVQGELSYDQGEITLTKPISVKGPSSDFRLGGHLNTSSQTLDMDLIVTLPVTQNIAVVSLLLGQPYIAGAAYLFDKLLGSRVEQFASLRYEIKGTFGEPDVKLDRLFSNKVQEQK